MSGEPAPAYTSTAEHPPPAAKPATSEHPPLTSSSSDHHAAQRGLAAAGPSPTAELASLTLNLKAALRQFPDFPSPGILFEDILPIFANPQLHEELLRALELHVAQAYEKPDVIVGLEARGFLFGPSLALRLGAAFVPVRKQGKLPGPCETAGYQKEYGEDFFQMQKDGVRPGQKVLVVDDIIATGGSAAAAGSLVKKLGGTLLGYVFMLELDFLKGRAKLDAPVYTLLSSQEK
ncbi:adenine phosphoribosyltransferase 1 [Lentithecium fluviatile CBS 122367]|uniref:adenine phosphoribosyltransferase n=1 Tax=Lentithecium fluviatile CBS 122367 TaxID=1168545 RepID=A0A6G1IH15_9PLEO|nr:adenine phosphoribosyltransferase 1 [Lentithecium fluviatile CBS 122367]